LVLTRNVDAVEFWKAEGITTQEVTVFTVTTCPRCHLPWRRPNHRKESAPCDRCSVKRKGLRMKNVRMNRSPSDDDWMDLNVKREDQG